MPRMANDAIPIHQILTNLPDYDLFKLAALFD
jgi:hypothetical protein